MKPKILLFASLLLTSQLIAAEAKPARRAANAPKRPQAGLAAPPGDAGKFERVLNDEQRQKLREYIQANGEKLRARRQETVKLRRELQDAVISGQADEAAIKEKSEAIARLEGEMLSARMNALAKVAATLTAEQKEKIKEMSEQVRAARPKSGAGLRKGTAPLGPPEPAAPRPPEK